MTSFKFAALLLILMLVAPALAAGSDRKVVARVPDCEITAGDRDERDNNLMLSYCSWPVAMEAIKSVFLNVADHDLYHDAVVESTVLPDGRVLQVHQASGISDRQVTLIYKNETFDDGGLRVSWTLAEQQEPLGSGRIQAVLDDGSWMVRPGKEGRSEITYSLRYEPGGRVPKFVVRAFQKNGIGEMLEEMRAAAVKLSP